MTITIIGTGFVGVVTAAVFSSFGHTVYGLDIDEEKVQRLRRSEVPFYEPNLETLLKEQQAEGHLHFTTNYQEAISNSDVIFIAVGTPSASDGQADLKFVLAAAESLAPYLQDNAVVVVKSTVPPGTLDKVAEVIDPLAKVEYHLASVPEFLKEGSAVHDTLHPDRIVIGATNPQVVAKLSELHKPLQAPILAMTPESAQMTKYAANAYLATRITFINQMADLCDKNGADIQQVIKGIGLDQRIGDHYWYPGFGYGGSCFPKDVKELAAYSRAVGEADNLFNKVNDLNDVRTDRLMTSFGEWLGGWHNKKVAVLGLSFKPNTDDMREAPSQKVISYLLSHQAQVTGFDPKATWPNSEISQAESIELAVTDADVIIALIEWPEIISFNFAETKSSNDQWFIDARNQFDPDHLRKIGYHYRGVGKG